MKTNGNPRFVVEHGVTIEEITDSRPWPDQHSRFLNK